MHLNKIMNKIREINDMNGWIIPEDAWEQETFIPTKLMLIVSESSEALEEFRNNDFDKFKVELADIMIRILDLCSGLKIDIEKEILHKLEINKSRGYKHGNKKV